MKQICPHCLKSVSVPEDAAGKDVTCPECGQSFPAPARYNPVVSAPPPTAPAPHPAPTPPPTAPAPVPVPPAAYNPAPPGLVPTALVPPPSDGWQANVGQWIRAAAGIPETTFATALRLTPQKKDEG